MRDRFNRVLTSILLFVILGCCYFVVAGHFRHLRAADEKFSTVVGIPFQMETIPELEEIEKEIEAEIEEEPITYVNLEVPFVSQYPELPTGCEITSLTMVMNYFGYDVAKTYMADNYMFYWQYDYQVGFLGSPYSIYGSKMLPPAIADSANYFLQSNNSNLIATDISGMDFNNLMAYIDLKYPVIVWVTEDFSEYPNWNGSVDYYNGHENYGYWGTHCIVIKGYDADSNNVIINNPQTGEQYINRDQMARVYDAVGRYAVVVTRNEDV